MLAIPIPRIIASLLVVLSFSIAQAQTPTNYSIKGTVPGMADGTTLYLTALGPEQKKLDSVTVKDGQFQLKGMFEHPGYQARLHTLTFTDYISFWLEKTPIELVSSNGKLKGASLTGGEIQNMSNAFSSRIAPFRRAADVADEMINKTTGVERKKWIDSSRTIREQELTDTRAFIAENPSSLYAVYLLSLYSTTWGKDIVSTLYNGLKNPARDSRWATEVNTYLTLSKNLKIGDAFVDFTQASPDGKKIALSQHKGKVVLLEFWASSCGPCREENPLLRKTYYAFKEKGFEIHAVSLDDNKTQWKAAIKADTLTWPQVSDLKGDKNEAALMYNVSGIPDNILIGKDGKIIARNLRGKALYDKLAEVLK